MIFNKNTSKNPQIKNVGVKQKKKDPINQIKNIKQEDEKIEKKYSEKIKNLDDLIKMCLAKK